MDHFGLGYYGRVRTRSRDKLNRNDKLMDIAAFQSLKIYGLYEAGYMQETLLSDDFISVPQYLKAINTL